MDAVDSPASAESIDESSTANGQVALTTLSLFGPVDTHLSGLFLSRVPYEEQEGCMGKHNAGSPVGLSLGRCISLVLRVTCLCSPRVSLLFPFHESP